MSSERLTFYDEFNNPCYRTKQYSPLYEQMVDTVVSNSDVARKLAIIENAFENYYMGETLCWLVGNEIYTGRFSGIISEYTDDDGIYHIKCQLTYNMGDRTDRRLVFFADDLGKIIFKTYGEAEQALQAVQK